MVLQLPRLTNSLRDPFDIDRAYLHRKTILQNLLSQSNAKSVDESELARKIVRYWDEASTEVRQTYKQFIGAVVELIDGEVVSEEFREVALTVYRLFCDRGEEDHSKKIAEKKLELQKLLGHAVSDGGLRKIVQLAQRLSRLQPNNDAKLEENIPDNDVEFGFNLDFKPPSRFLMDIPLEDEELLGPEDLAPSTSLYNDWPAADAANNRFPNGGIKYDLNWLRDSCDLIVRGSGSQLSPDELAMTICRVLDSDKPREEIAGDLLDHVGDSAFETVQELISHRKERVDIICHGLLVLQSDKPSSNAHPRMPIYGTQVTVQTESEKQIDKLRRKEEKRHKRGVEHGLEDDFSCTNFSPLLEASERKNLFDDVIGSGPGPQSLGISALLQGAVRKHFKGCEEVIIPPIPTARMKPGEKLIEIKELDQFAQAAFQGYKSLNRIQSRIFQTVYYTNENILYDLAPIELAAANGNVALVTLLFDVTAPLPRIQNWSCQGIIDYANSPEIRAQWDLKLQSKFPVAKENGAEAYKKEQYYNAIFWYTKAAKIKPSDPTVFSNRSLCWARLNDGDNAIKDAMYCIALKPKWSKAYYRAGVAWKILQVYDKAVEAFGRGLDLDPNNKELQDAYKEAEDLASVVGGPSGHCPGCPECNM